MIYENASDTFVHFPKASTSHKFISRCEFEKRMAGSVFPQNSIYKPTFPRTQAIYSIMGSDKNCADDPDPSDVLWMLHRLARFRDRPVNNIMDLPGGSEGCGEADAARS